VHELLIVQRRLFSMTPWLILSIAARAAGAAAAA
jgi:hypothetical protein